MDLAHEDRDLALFLKNFTQQRLDRFEVEGFAGNLRSVNTALTGEAKFQFLHKKSAEKI